MAYLRRDAIVRKMWALGFVFVHETKLAHIFKRGPYRIVVPKLDHLEEGWVRTELRRCQLSDEETECATCAA
jgi:hypothetical protein